MCMLSSWCGVSTLRYGFGGFGGFGVCFLHKFPLLFYHRKGLSLCRHSLSAESIVVSSDGWMDGWMDEAGCSPDMGSGEGWG